MNLNQTIEAARNVLRFKHMAIKTEKSYVHWIQRFAHWCKYLGFSPTKTSAYAKYQDLMNRRRKNWQIFEPISGDLNKVVP